MLDGENFLVKDQNNDSSNHHHHHKHRALTNMTTLKLGTSVHQEDGRIEGCALTPSC